MSKIIELNTRTFTIKKNQDYKFPSKGLIHSWEIKCNVPNLKLLINNYIVNIKLQNPLFFPVSEIRNYIRNIDCPETIDENNLCNIEGLLFKSQIDAIEFYPTLTTQNLYNSIFNRDLTIQLKCLDNSDTPDEILIEETYWDRKGNKEYDRLEKEREQRNKNKEEENDKDDENIQKYIKENIKPINSSISNLE